MTTPLTTPLTFDYLILGGGSAGCALAERLSRSGAHTVALLEAGGVADSALVHCPAGLAVMAQTGQFNWKFDTAAQPGLNGRRGYQPRGKGLGGSSAINAMVYMRGHASDYDGWARAVGEDPATSRWGWARAGHTFRSFEHNEAFNNPADAAHAAHHGGDWVEGQRLNVKNLDAPNPFSTAFVAAARQAGYDTTDDFNGAFMHGDGEALGLYQVTHRAGERHTAAKAFLSPHLSGPLQRKNLTVFTRAQVRRVVFDAPSGNAHATSRATPRATGVEVKLPSGVQTLYAQREVLLCAGALQSPQVLMLSGVGDAAHLQAHGIPFVAHVPGVGQNLQDHIDTVQLFDTPGRAELFGVSLPFVAKALRGILDWRQRRAGLLTTNLAEAGGFIKSSPDEPIADLQLHFVVGKLINHGRTPTLGHGFSAHICLLRPKSRGSVQLASSDPSAVPRIDPAFFSDPSDLQKMVKAYRLLRRILQAPALAEHVAQSGGKELLAPKSLGDEGIAQHLRQYADTVYHPVGSCKMGAAADPLAVVDAELKVRGVQGLRVVDASIMPHIVGGNTNAPAIMIAQTAADMLLEIN